MRKSLFTIGTAILIIAFASSSINAPKKVHSLNRVTNLNGNDIGANGASNGQSYAITGCAGGCHGTKVSANCTAVLSGLPSNNTVTAGQTYTLSLVITNSATTLTAKKWGFDIFSTDGTFSTTNPNAQVDVNWALNNLTGAEIHHGATAPSYTATKAAPSYTFDKMTWTAPATPGADTFYYAANAADGNGSANTKDYTMLSNPIILKVNPSSTPVTLASFAVSTAASQATISWSTATEINTDHFEVERSLDGKSYTVVGKVAATGNSKNLVPYSFSNNVASLTGTVYYRLKSVDKGGQFNYSNTQTINIKTAKNYITNLYPNPLHAGQDIRFTYQSLKAASVTFQLYNATGKKVTNSNLFVSEGSNALSLPVGQHLNTGVYYLTVSVDNAVVQKLPLVVE